MRRSLLLLTLVMVVACVYVLFQIKHEVKNLKRDLVEIHRQLANDKEAIHVLKAEWAYLSQPSRVKKLADEHLDLVAIDSQQLKEIAYLSDNLGTLRSYAASFEVTPTLKPLLSSARGF